MKKRMDIIKKMSFTRFGGTEEELKCAQYLQDIIRNLGVECELEAFEVQGADIEKASLKVIEPYEKEINCLAYIGCANCEKLTGEAILFRNNDQAMLAQCKDKIVIIDGFLRYWTYKDIYEAGAKAVICSNGFLYDDNRDVMQLELRKIHQEIGKLPVLQINIKDVMSFMNKKTVKLEMTIKQQEKTMESHNVVARIKGQSDQNIVCCAHYDSSYLSKGSWDNASGSVGIIALIEYFVKNRPLHNLTFVLCGSEERGLLGSKAFVDKHEEELSKIALNINIDMIGSKMGNFLACCSSEMKLVDYLSYLALIKGKSLKSYQGVYSSDSTPFADKGIPAMSFGSFTGTTPIHCRYDEPSFVKEDILDDDISFITEFVDQMANAVVIPVKKEIPANIKEELDKYLMRKRP